MDGQMNPDDKKIPTVVNLQLQFPLFKVATSGSLFGFL